VARALLSAKKKEVRVESRRDSWTPTSDRQLRVYFRKGMRPGRACSEAASNGAHARPPRSHLQQARGAKSLYRVDASIGSGLRWKIQRATANPTADVHQVESFHNSPYSTTTAGVR